MRARGISIVIAWFAIVITGRYPKGLYDFVADYNRFLARVTAYAVLPRDTLAELAVNGLPQQGLARP